MSCAAFRERGDRGGAADTHADACPSCREWLERQRRAQAALARLAGTLDGGGAPPHVEEGLRRAFREKFEPATARAPLAPPAPPLAWRFRPQRLTWAIVAVAACLVVAITVVLARKGPAGATRSVAKAGPAPTTGVIAPSKEAAALATMPASPAEAAASSAAGAPRVPPSRSKRRPPSATPAALAATEDAAPAPGAVTPVEPAREAASAPVDPLRAATVSIADPAGSASEAEASARASTSDAPDARAFYPLRPEPDPSLVDSGQVVRVQLREDVLRAAGLSPGPDSSERVEAEVLVGPDGVARGIRLARPRR